MKVNKKIVYVITMAVMLMTVKIVYTDIFSDIGKKASDITNDIGDVAKKGWTSTRDFAKDQANKITNKISGCSDVVALGTQWAAEKAALESYRGLLIAAETLQEVSTAPLRTQLVGVTAAKEAALKGLVAAEGLATATNALGQATAKAVEVTGMILTKGFNLKRVAFSASIKDLKAGKLPKCTVIASVAGQDIKIEGLQLNLKDIPGTAQAIIKAVIAAVA